MKKLKVATMVLGLVLSGVAFAQADSSDVPPLRGAPRVLPLAMQERETPVVNNVTNTTNQITQQINGAELIDTSSAYITGTNCGFDEGTAQWMLSCGKRACQSFGYTSGNVVEYFGGGATLACLR